MTARLPAFTMTARLKDGRTIVGTAFLQALSDDGFALYELCLHGVTADEVESLTWRIAIENAYVRLRCLPDVVDLRGR